MAKQMGKRMARMTEKLTKPAVYELKKKAERERLRMYRERQKLGLIHTKQTSTSTEVFLQDQSSPPKAWTKSSSIERRGH